MSHLPCLKDANVHQTRNCPPFKRKEHILDFIKSNPAFYDKSFMAFRDTEKYPRMEQYAASMDIPGEYFETLQDISTISHGPSVKIQYFVCGKCARYGAFAWNGVKWHNRAQLAIQSLSTCEVAMLQSCDTSWQLSLFVRVRNYFWTCSALIKHTLSTCTSVL